MKKSELRSIIKTILKEEFITDQGFNDAKEYETKVPKKTQEEYLKGIQAGIIKLKNKMREDGYEV